MKTKKKTMLQILQMTPDRIKTIVSTLDEDLLRYKPDPEHFSILDIIGHLIHGEDDDWIPRLKLTLEEDKPTYTSFDRFAHKKFIENMTIDELVDNFQKKRKNNVEYLQELELTSALEKREAIHPSLGEVNVAQLLNTWVVHDLSHLNQINRILSSIFDDVGPWQEYLRILNE